MRILCVFGKYNYGDPSRGLGYEYVNFIPALRKLNHEVVFFDSWDRTQYRDCCELNSSLLSTVRKVQPDVMFTILNGVQIWLETLEAIRDEGSVATIYWATDDSWHYEDFSRFVGPAFHVAATTYTNAVRKYHRDGMPRVFLTQWGYSSDRLAPPIPASQCEYRVTFTGTAHGNRPHWIAGLRERGIEVDCFGHGWPRGAVSDSDLIRIIRTSCISLNFGNSCLSWEKIIPKRVDQLKARVFEIPGAGGFLLTQWVDDIPQWFTIGKEIATFKNIDELAGKIRYYLSHQDERDAMCWAGFLRTKRDHLYEKRLTELLYFALRSHETFRRDAGLNLDCSSTTLDAFKVDGSRYTCGSYCRLLKKILVLSGNLIFGRKRGMRAARRLVTELSWRIVGSKAYRSSGLTCRMFPNL